MTIPKIINSIYTIPEASMEKLSEKVREVKFSKGHILIRAETIERKLFFIKKGIVRAYANQSGEDVTFWFGMEGDTVVSMKSYVLQERGYENIELLEDSEFYEIAVADLQQLYLQDIHIANWGRKFAEVEIIKTEERLIAFQFQTATQRYKELMDAKPQLVQRVKLNYIASYLGITQVSLSRIRAEIK